ncbi:MAG TPA: hypothetical protein PLL77_11140 [Pyrinomonadaceae bacterium]|nr:hypothetical protein [Pyrinomonadaceae bacterium]
MKETFAVTAAILAIVGNIPYIVDIFKGRVQPHAYTWFVWTLVTSIVFFGQVAKGAGIGALPTAAAGIFTLLIFLLSLKNGFKHVTKIDTIFLLLALAGIVPWVITKDPTISVVIAVAIDLTAFIPTLRKTWLKPSTESPLLYGSNVLRHILALLSMQTYNIATTLHSIAMLITNTTMSILLVTAKPEKESGD